MSPEPVSPAPVGAVPAGPSARPGPLVHFTGDSITEWGRDGTPGDLGTGYVARLAAGPLRTHRVVNTGVGGDRVADLARRWHRDVTGLAPGDLLSVAVGVNDTWRRYDHGLTTPVADFARTLHDLLAPHAARGVRLVLVEPFVVPLDAAQRGWDEDLVPKQAALREIAHDLDAVHVATSAAFRSAAAAGDPYSVVLDGVHPTGRGHRLLADLWWWALGSHVPRRAATGDHPPGAAPSTAARGEAAPTTGTDPTGDAPCSTTT